MGAFPESVARFYFKQLIDGLDYLHSSGIAHRDLKPDNLLLTKDFVLKIADFGYSKALSETRRGLTKSRVGTDAYMAPEVLYGHAYFPICADLFSCGVILFILYTGHPPFQFAETKDFWYQHIA